MSIFYTPLRLDSYDSDEELVELLIPIVQMRARLRRLGREESIAVAVKVAVEVRDWLVRRGEVGRQRILRILRQRSEAAKQFLDATADRKRIIVSC